MYSSLLPAVAGPDAGNTVKRMVFLLDFVVLPVMGLSLLFIVYKLVKSKKITVNREEQRDGS